MRYMFLVISPERAGPPPQRLMEEVGKLAQREMAAGALVDQGGLMPLAMGARVRVADGRLTVMDGPFTETKEVIGGYAIFELPNRDVALERAKEFMELHRLHGDGWEGVCEMRQLAPMGPPG